MEAFFAPSGDYDFHAWHFGRLTEVARSGASVQLTIEWLVEDDGSSVVPVPVSEVDDRVGTDVVDALN